MSHEETKREPEPDPPADTKTTAPPTIPALSPREAARLGGYSRFSRRRHRPAVSVLKNLIQEEF
jgi:hypothetical protein